MYDIPHAARRARLAASVLAVTAAALLCACGGGGGGSSAAASPPPARGGTGASSGWAEGVFLDAETFADQCLTPRTGTDALAGTAYPDRQGTALDENNWLRSWSHELYLWYDEIVDRDPGLYSTSDYFELLKTDATTPSGAPQDKFHFTYSTDEWRALSQSGITAGYGIEWSFVSLAPPREAIVAFTEPGSPADQAGIQRGARLLAIDDVDFIHGGSQSDVDLLNDALFPDGAGRRHRFEVQPLGETASRVVELVSENVVTAPVPTVATIDTSSGPVGYLLFNAHIATAEQALVDAVETLTAASVVDLVLDLRYNGGGYLVIASQLAYMIAGDVPTAGGGQTFEQLEFNDKHPSTNPVTGTPLRPYPFETQTIGLSTAAGQPLPTLDLPRVFVLTGPDTCSASESVINALRGVDVEVVQIGSTTCGKPYGFYPTDNCGTTYFSIQFKGVNAKGYGDYTDGFTPAATPQRSDQLPGCDVADDFGHALGDSAEARLATALQYRESGSCPATPSATASSVAKSATLSPIEGRLLRPPWRENRLLDR